MESQNRSRNRNMTATIEVTLPAAPAPRTVRSLLGHEAIIIITYMVLFLPQLRQLVVNLTSQDDAQQGRCFNMRVLIHRSRVRGRTSDEPEPDPSARRRRHGGQAKKRRANYKT